MWWHVGSLSTLFLLLLSLLRCYSPQAQSTINFIFLFQGCKGSSPNLQNTPILQFEISRLCDGRCLTCWRDIHQVCARVQETSQHHAGCSNDCITSSPTLVLGQQIEDSWSECWDIRKQHVLLHTRPSSTHAHNAHTTHTAQTLLLIDMRTRTHSIHAQKQRKHWLTYTIAGVCVSVQA